MDSESKGKKPDFGKDEEGKQALSKVAPAANDEQHARLDEKVDAQSLKLAKRTSSPGKVPRTIRFTKDQILKIYRGLGDFKSPLTNAAKYEIEVESDQFLELIMNAEPNVVLQTMKELPPHEAHLGNKGKIFSSIIDNNINQTKK